MFIGEYGFPADRYTPQEQDTLSRRVMRIGLEWGCPFALYWEMYNNEVRDGRQRGFWLIDNEGRKQPIYFTLQKYYEERPSLGERLPQPPAASSEFDGVRPELPCGGCNEAAWHRIDIADSRPLRRTTTAQVLRPGFLAISGAGTTLECLEIVQYLEGDARTLTNRARSRKYGNRRIGAQLTGLPHKPRPADRWYGVC